MAKVKSSSYDTDVELAEQQYVEDKVGDTIRTSLYPFCYLLRDVYPEGYARLVEEELTGEEWIRLFISPSRFGWRGKRFSSDVVCKISELTHALEQLLEHTAQTYRETQHVRL